ncbi:MAG TPA: SpoIIE family protein phosphatase [Terriglobales bacterium]
MRIIPGFGRRFFRRRHKRPQHQGWLPSVGSVLMVELVCAGVILGILLTGSRGRYLDALHPRADAALVAFVAVLVGGSHLLFVSKVLPYLRKRTSPGAYDQQRILLDLGEAARYSNNISDVFKFSADTIASALQATNVSILVRDETTGDFLLRSSSIYATADGVNTAPTRDEADIALPKEAFVVRRLANLASPLRLEKEDLDIWSRAAAFIQGLDSEKRRQEQHALAALRSRVLVQIRTKSQLIGILSVSPRRSGIDFSDNDLRMLMSIAEQMALVVENSNLLERIVDQEKMRHELALAASVQRHLFPIEAPSSPKIEISGWCKPAGFVGGDYYDFIQFDNGQIGMAVADVAGKGFSAALLTFMIHAFLRSQTIASSSSAYSDSLANIASSLNRLLFASTSSASYVTFFYAQYDERTGRLSFVNAGHNPPFVLQTNGSESGARKSNGSVMRLTAGGPVLGLFKDCPVQENSFELHPGDFLLAYTDGAIEAANRTGEEFGEERLLSLVKSKSHLPAMRARDEIFRSIEEWCAGAPQFDDITLVVLKVSAAA